MFTSECFGNYDTARLVSPFYDYECANVEAGIGDLVGPCTIHRARNREAAGRDRNGDGDRALDSFAVAFMSIMSTERRFTSDSEYTSMR